MTRFKAGVMVSSHLCIWIFAAVTFVMSMSVANGCGVTDAVKISLVLTVQWSAGALIWSRMIKPGITTTIESAAIGAPIGFALSALLDQAFINTPGHSFAWVFPAIFVLLDMLIRAPKQNFGQIELENTQALVYAIAATLVGLSGFYSLYLSGLIPILAYLYLQHIHRNQAITFKQTFTLILVSAFCTYLAITLNHPSPNSLLRPIYYDTDDHIFGEQLSTSIARWGLSENSSAIGTPIKYHWLSFGWSGLVTRASGAGSWIVNLHVIPILVFLILALIVISITQVIKNQHWIIALFPLLLFTADDPSTTLRFYFNGATSNLLPHIWLAATVYLLLQNPMDRSFRFRFMLILLSTATILGKGPFGVVLCCGFLCLILYGMVFWNRKIMRPIIWTSISAVTSMAVAFFVFIADENLVTYSPQLNQIKSLFPFPVLTDRPIGSRFSLYIGIVFFVTFIFRRFWMLTIPYKRNLETSAQSVYLIGCFLGGLLTFFLYNLGGTQYFLNGSLTACTLGGIYFLKMLIQNAESSLLVPRDISMYLVGGGILWITLSTLLHLFDLKTPQYLVPLSLLIITTVIVWVRNRSTTFKLRSLVQLMAMPGILIFSIANFLAFAQKIDFKLMRTDSELIEATTAQDELIALSWISSHSPQETIVATNRSLCEWNPQCQYDDSSHLVAAVSRRRVLLEGPYFVHQSRRADGTYQEWASLRAKISLGFVDSPTKQLTKQLASYGVTILYVQKSATQTRSWEPWASTVYENQSAAVLLLNS